MAWETKTFHFECRGCNEPAQYEGRKCPTWCGDCRASRIRLLSLVGTNENYPRKLCDGCSIHMSNLDYGNARLCADCTVVRTRRHDGWSDPYAPKSRILIAANDNALQMKACKSCECELPLSDFGATKTGGLGVTADCRDCRAAWRAFKDRSAEYERRKRARVIVSGGERVANKNRKIRISDRLRKRDVSERRSVGRSIETYLMHFYKPWTRPNLSGADKWRIRYENDLAFRLRNITKARMRRKGIGRDAMHHMRRVLYGVAGPVALSSIEAAVGYSMVDFKNHLERRFTDGMNWDVFKTGAIHIDHIRPLNTFDLSNPEEATKAWAMSNLRPLWAHDNCARPKDGRDVDWRGQAANDTNRSALQAA